jgi:hypothetical protein
VAATLSKLVGVGSSGFSRSQFSRVSQRRDSYRSRSWSDDAMRPTGARPAFSSVSTVSVRVRKSGGLLDAGDPAAVRRCEDQRGAAAASREIEHA